jgi:hypothetical protein
VELCGHCSLGDACVILSRWTAGLLVRVLLVSHSVKAVL